MIELVDPNQAGIMNLNGAIFVAIVINLTFGNLFPVLTVFCAGPMIRKFLIFNYHY